MAIGFDSGFETAGLGTLTAAGVGSTITCAGVNLTFQIVVSSISTNVVIRFEGSLDNTNFFNLDQSNADTTITSNGTFGFALSGCPVKFARLRLVSISGGTPTVIGTLGAM